MFIGPRCLLWANIPSVGLDSEYKSVGKDLAGVLIHIPLWFL